MVADLISPADFDEAAKGLGQSYRLGAQNAIRRYCGWHIAPVIEETMILDGTGGQTLLLKSLRVKDITAVWERGRQFLVPDEVEWSESGVLTRLAGRWTTRFRAVRIDLQHGFDDAPELSSLVVSIAERAKASPAGVVSETAGAVNIRFSTFGSGAAGGVALMEHEYGLLNSYRLPPGRR